MVAQSPRLNLDDLFAEEVSVLPAEAPSAQMLGLLARPQGVGSSAQVATLRGAVAAGDLQSGDMILTRDGGYAPLASVQACSTQMIKVALPFLAATSGQYGSVAVASGASVLLTDDRFPALFGTREVLVAAECLGGAVMEHCGVTIVLARPALISVDGLWIETAGEGPQTRPLLSDREAAVAIRLVTSHAVSDRSAA